MIFSAHPYDETISCSGYIQREIKNKFKVWIILITDGNRREIKFIRYRKVL